MSMLISVPGSPISGWAPHWWPQTPWFYPPPLGSSGHNWQPALPGPAAPPSPPPLRLRFQPGGGSALPGGSRDHGGKRLEAGWRKSSLTLFYSFKRVIATIRKADCILGPIKTFFIVIDSFTSFLTPVKLQRSQVHSASVPPRHLLDLQYSPPPGPASAVSASQPAGSAGWFPHPVKGKDRQQHQHLGQAKHHR